ncbi:NADAR family protein [Campylobacter concisus]|uniref:NADAR family protein n=1 Tax=Campylobacter concisus TaxID=199 RepID=UPI001E386987|nr:NADAR family protein [Campylobacter concisus]
MVECKAKKAECFGDKEALEQILSAKDPAQMKALGRQVRGFDAKVWDEIKFGVVLNASYLKFSQNAPLRDFLLSTGSKVLVEASPVDKIWGIGLAASDENAQNPMKWQGQNLLGFALMRARDEIAKVYKNVHLCDARELNLDHL